jgi:hypothetical protein
MAGPVARSTSRLQLVDDRASADLERRLVVVLEELGGTAVDATTRPFEDDAALPCRRMAMTTRRVDRSTLGVVDQRPEERRGGEAFDEASRHRRAVVEGAAVAAHVDHDLRHHLDASAIDQPHQSIGSLLGHPRPPRADMFGHGP